MPLRSGRLWRWDSSRCSGGILWYVFLVRGAQQDGNTSISVVGCRVKLFDFWEKYALLKFSSCQTARYGWFYSGMIFFKLYLKVTFSFVFHLFIYTQVPKYTVPNTTTWKHYYFYINNSINHYSKHYTTVQSLSNSLKPLCPTVRSLCRYSNQTICPRVHGGFYTGWRNF